MTIYLFGYLLLLFAGGLALLFTTYRRYQRTGDPLLLSYLYYLLAVNATVFDSVIGEAFLSLTSTTRHLSSVSIETSSKILCLLSVPLMFIGWYFFLKMMAKMMGRNVSRMVWIVYIAAQLLAAAAFAVMVANFVATPTLASSRAYATAFMVVRWLGCFIRFLALAQIVFYIGSLGESRRRRSVLRFGGIYAVLLAVYYGVLLLPPPRAIFVLAYPIIYFVTDYVPLFYLLGVLRREFREISPVSSGTSILSRLAEVHGLTKREREIVGLILSGKDNIDIHRVLFISAGTVRNHVSSIYRKLGLKNRYQLLALARNEGGQERSAEVPSSRF